MKMMEIFKSKWGEWTDILVGEYGSNKIILQGRRHKNGKLQIRQISFTINKDLKVEDLKKVKNK